MNNYIVSLFCTEEASSNKSPIKFKDEFNYSCYEEEEAVEKALEYADSTYDKSVIVNKTSVRLK